MPNQEKTPRRTFRSGEIWEKAKPVAAYLGDTLTDVLNAALVEYVKTHDHEPTDCCGCTLSAPCDVECDGGLIEDWSALTHCTRCQRDMEEQMFDASINTDPEDS